MKSGFGRHLRIGRMAAPKAEAQLQTLGGTPPPAYHSCSGAKPHCPTARCFGAQCLLIAHEAVSPAHERYAGGGVPPMLAQQFFTPRSSLPVLHLTYSSLSMCDICKKISAPPRLAPGKLQRRGVRKCTWGMAQPQSLSRHGDGLRFCPEKKIIYIFGKDIYDLLKRYV